MLKKISIPIAIIACLVNEFTKGLYNGFSYGASKMCETVYPIIEIDGVKSWISHADPYFYITSYQIYLTYTLAVFVIWKFFESRVSTQILSFVPIGFAMYFWWQIEEIKSKDIKPLDNYEPSKYIDLLRETTQYSQALIIFFSALLVLQIVTISISLYEKIKQRKMMTLA